jgi:hypothetical protein
MSDNKQKRGPPDRSKINKNEPYEVGYAARTMHTSPAKIHEAVKEVGPGRRKVAEYIKKEQAKK